MRTTFIILLVFAAAAAVVSGYRTVDDDSNSREPSTSSSQEGMILEGISSAIGESASPPSIIETLALIAAAPAGTIGTSSGVDNSASWSSTEKLEDPAEAFIGIFAGSNDTDAGSSCPHGGTNNTLPPEMYLQWSVDEILERLASYIEYGRRMLKMSSGTMRSSSSMEVAGCASMILGMTPCIIDFFDPSVDRGLRKPTDACCNGVRALSTPSAAGGAVCACHLLRDPFDLHLDVGRMDALFSKCDDSHFSIGSFAKLCQETGTLPPLIMFLDPESENTTNTTNTVPEPVPPVKPAINASWEIPENNTNWGNSTKNGSWKTISGAADLVIVGGRELFHMAALFLLFAAFS